MQTWPTVFIYILLLLEKKKKKELKCRYFSKAVIQTSQLSVAALSGRGFSESWVVGNNNSDPSNTHTVTPKLYGAHLIIGFMNISLFRDLVPMSNFLSFWAQMLTQNNFYCSQQQQQQQQQNPFKSLGGPKQHLWPKPHSNSNSTEQVALHCSFDHMFCDHFTLLKLGPNEHFLSF